MVVGICQTDIVFEDKKYNLISAEDYIAKCKDKGAQLVLFPEMSMTGFTMEPEKVYENPDDNYTLNVMKEYATRYNTAVGFGYIKKVGPDYTNCYAFVDNKGTLLCEYAKTHPFSIAGEDEHYASGNELKLCTINGITICPLICYELRFPELFQIASAKADLIVVPANWNGRRTEHWNLLLKARALENQCYVIGVNRVGEDNETFYLGDSMMVNPEGQIIDILEDKPGIMIVDVDKEQVEESRKEFPVKKDRRPELYRRLMVQ